MRVEGTKFWAPRWRSRVARRSLALALLAALLSTAAGAAFALTAEVDEQAAASPLYYVGEALDPQVGALPFTVVDERPDPKAATARAVSQVWGSQLNFALNLNSSLASSIYFGKSLPLYEALRRGSLLGDDEAAPGLLALRGPGAAHVLANGRAVQQKLNYVGGRFQLQGSYVDVDTAFSMPGIGSVTVVGDRSLADTLAAMRGMKELKFQAQYTPWKALSLTASRRRFVNEQPGNQQIGMTVDETAQGLAYQFSGNRQFKLDYQKRDEDWRGHGPINMTKMVAHLDATSRLALDYSYDWNNIEREGHKEKGRNVTEIKESLAYRLSGDNQLALNYRKFDEQWAGKGPMQVETLMASLKPTSRLQLTYSRDHTANDREGSNEKGLTRDVTKQSLLYQLSAQTRLDLNFNQTSEAWNRSGTNTITETKSADYALHQVLGKSTKADLVRNLTTVAANGAKTDIDTTQLHFEHKPGERFNLVADWMDRNRSDGGAEDQTSLSLDSVIGSGKGRLALKGLYQQHAQGTGDKQVDTLYHLGLATAPSPLLQLKADYEAFNQHGPTAEHDFVRTNLGLASQLCRYARLTADYARETDKQAQTKADQALRLELNPGWLALSGAINRTERQGQADLTTTTGDLQIKFGRALANWAKAVSGADPLTRASSYGYRGAPGWAALGDGAMALNYIGRATDGKPEVATRVLGYQTMLGRHAYVKLAMHNNPMIKKDDQMVMESVRRDAYEGGIDLSNGFAALSRFIREEDLTNGSAIRGRVLGLRGAIGGGDILTFISGVQKLQAGNGLPTNWQFTNLNLKFGRPLADWAKVASNAGAFDDNVKYGYQQLPGWASFADGGLGLQYMAQESPSGEKLIASAAGYQSMLDKRMYVKLSLQQNPLNDKGEIIPVDRKLYELGRRFGGKFVALARYISDDNFAEHKSLRTSMLGLRGRLSERERMETVIVLDDTTSQGASYRTRTYGLEYAREVGEGHYLIIKGRYTQDAPAFNYARDDYQVDFAYKKDI